MARDPYCMGVCMGGGQNGHLPPPAIGSKKQKFPENVKSGF